MNLYHFFQLLLLAIDQDVNIWTAHHRFIGRVRQCNNGFVLIRTSGGDEVQIKCAEIIAVTVS